LKKNSLGNSEEQKQKLLDEINIVKSIDHPNILKMYEFFEQRQSFFLVTEVCKGGELFDEIIRRKKFSERDAAVLMKQILSCINFCHMNKIVHRDIKAENVMLEHDKDFNAIKIIDFGTAIIHDSDEPLTEVLGTPFYMAPEVIKKNYCSRCDIWSCGVMTCILVSGIPPFTGADSNEIMESVCEGKISFEDEVWSDVSDECKDFIRQLLTYKAEDRPSAAEVLKHPWITKLGNTEVDKSASLGALDNLKKFNAGSIMKRATVAYISSQLLSR